MCKRLCFLLFILFCCSLAFGSGIPCPTLQPGWCNVYSSPPLTFNGYETAIWDSTTNTYLEGGNDFGKNPGMLNACLTCTPAWTTPEINDIAEGKWLDSTGNPWTELITSGNNANDRQRDAVGLLKYSVSSTDTSMTFMVGQQGQGSISSIATIIPQNCGSQDANGNVTTGSCVLWVGNEYVTYAKCSETAPTPTDGSCGNGTTEYRLDGLVRGVRGTVPQPHLGCGGPNTKCGVGNDGYGELASLAAQNPLRNINGKMMPVSDGPPDVHYSEYGAYDPSRGKMYIGFGWDERYSSPRFGWFCKDAIPNAPPHDPNDITAKCNVTDLSDGVHFVANPHLPTIPSYSEGVFVYDPVGDAVFMGFGLAGGGATANQFVFCLTPLSSEYGCNKSSNPVALLQQFTKITPHDGFPGQRDAPRAIFDPVNNVIQVAMGLVTNSNGTGYTNSFASYNPLTGDWCVSNTTESVWATSGAGKRPFNAASCAPPFQTPLTVSLSVANYARWPGWAWEPDFGLPVFFDGCQLKYYNYSTNSVSSATNFACTQGTNAPLGNQITQQQATSLVCLSGKGCVYIQNGASLGDLWEIPLSNMSGPLSLIVPQSCGQEQLGYFGSCQLQARGGLPPYQFSETGQLPPGVTLSGNGVLSGTPLQLGNFPITIYLKDSDN